jgi:hypothetical protein
MLASQHRLLEWQRTANLGLDQFRRLNKELLACEEEKFL